MTQHIKNNPSFESAYQKLNAKQKQAVDSLEGPLLVIAGPGTGKTQILAIRIGNILLNTDLNPRNILCLTFTDSGAINMRDRLLEFIGPTAYEIAIHTFHSFCNMVIRENPESFEQYSSYEVISYLEKNQLILNILDDLDRSHLFYRYNRNYRRELFALPQLFEKLKRKLESRSNAAGY
ncbi:MAG: UvrD-helicase domain-containing protein [Saprospiraceae bacterium]|nr:UvrD-helicase domain-containing protein [Saprospiraceae bacterium]